MDLAMASDGNCEGSMGVQGTGTFELRVVDGDGFFKADEAFWASQAGAQADQIIQVVGDRWVAASGPAAEMLSVCDRDEFLSDLDGAEVENPGEVIGTEEVDGEESVVLTFSSDDGNDGTAYVQAAEPHLIVKMEVDGEGAMTFSDFDEPVQPDRPTGDEVVDFGQLGCRPARAG